MSTRLPATGHYSVASGGVIGVDRVIFKGEVEPGARLTIAVSGEELDWPACLDRNDKLSRYVRTLAVPTRSIRMGPGDEPNDPESLTDWKLWYTIEVS